jgi:hypothetical protein
VSKSDRRKMRVLSLVFLAGVLAIWAGLAQRSENLQLVGEAACVVGFAWLALGGWRVSLLE